MEKKGFSAPKFVISLLRKQTCLKIPLFYLSYKGNNKIYYEDIFIVGQIVPLLKQPEKLDEYQPKENEVKIICAIYDTVSGPFLGLENCLGYLTVRGDGQENFF